MQAYFEGLDVYKRQVLASFLREVGAVLLNIHGQHDSQHLLQSERHVEFLDALAGVQPLLTQYRECYGQAVELMCIRDSVKIVKGKGVPYAQQNPSLYHGVSPFDAKTGEIPAHAPSFCGVFGKKMLELAAKDDKIAAITACLLYTSRCV